MPTICVATRNSLRSSAPLLPGRFFHRLLVRYRFLQTAPELIRNCSGTDFQTAFCNLLGRFGDIVSVSDGVLVRFVGGMTPELLWNGPGTALELLWNGFEFAWTFLMKLFRFPTGFWSGLLLKLL